MKPSEHSPVCADRIAGLFDGLLPEGVLQVLHGDGELGSALVGNQLVRALSFTGSERTGRTVAERLAGRGAAAQCEMGGQNASIVLADADPRPRRGDHRRPRDGLRRAEVHRHQPGDLRGGRLSGRARGAGRRPSERMVVEDPEDEAARSGR
jgi:hypothetical protein